MTGGGRRCRLSRTSRALALAVAIVATVVTLTSVPVAASLDTATPQWADRVLVRTYRTLFARKMASAGSYWYAQLIGHPDAHWFALALMDSAEYRNGPGALSDNQFITRMYRNSSGRDATGAEATWWLTAIRNRSQDRAGLVAWLVEHRFSFALRHPSAGVPCSQFRSTGPTPICEAGSAGTQRDVSILAVPNTDLRVNKAWFGSVVSLLSAARAAGYTLDGEWAENLPTWIFSPGSWRTWDDQQWLFAHGFPANPPGKSMHEWGLAIDFICNGQIINKDQKCWDWVRTNAPHYGVYLFHAATTPSHSEAGHFSSTGN